MGAQADEHPVTATDGAGERVMAAGERNVDPLLAAYLARHDARCPGCGYNLRGLETDRCPECGAGFEIGLRGVMPGMRTWIACVIMTCVGLGFAAMITLIGGLELLTWGYVEGIEYLVYGTTGVSLIASVVYLALLTRRRAVLWQRSRRGLLWTRVFSAGLLAVPPAMFGVLIIYVLA